VTDSEDSSVGKILSSARKKKRLRYKKISSELNIEESYLIALEEEKFDSIPGGETYIKGYLRSYAKKLDLNPNLIVETFLKENTSKQTKPRDFSQSKNFRTFSYIALLRNPLVLFFISFLLLCLIFLLFRSSFEPEEVQKTFLDNDKNIILEGNITQSEKLGSSIEKLHDNLNVISPTLNASEEFQDNKEEILVDQTISRENLLFIKVIEECWLEVFSDNERLLYRLSQAGEEYAFNEERLKLIVGNFKNVQVSFNDKIVNLSDNANTNKVSCIVFPLGECSEFKPADN
tara:strand:+ start:1768 stop:2634 length:867 start_codon:yes stop_codon:yes gene_type:complete